MNNEIFLLLLFVFSTNSLVSDCDKSFQYTDCNNAYQCNICHQIHTLEYLLCNKDTGNAHVKKRTTTLKRDINSNVTIFDEIQKLFHLTNEIMETIIGQNFLSSVEIFFNGVLLLIYSLSVLFLILIIYLLILPWFYFKKKYCCNNKKLF